MIRSLLTELLTREGHLVEAAEGSSQAICVVRFARFLREEAIIPLEPCMQVDGVSLWR